MSYRVILADDEPLARRGVRAQLRDHPDFVVVRDCRSGDEAIASIAELAPDLVMLDVEMPGLGGFDVVSALAAAMPPVIFLTAYAQYAVPAFDVAAVDYLLKPLDRDRLALALDRARRAIAARRANTPPGAETPPPLEPLVRFWVRTRSGVVLVRVDDVDFIAAEGDYARLHVGERSYLIPDSLTSLESRLPAAFLRIHRSTIVNHSRVTAVRPQGGTDHVVELRSGAQLRLSRSYYRRAAARLRL